MLGCIVYLSLFSIFFCSPYSAVSTSLDFFKAISTSPFLFAIITSDPIPSIPKLLDTASAAGLAEGVSIRCVSVDSTRAKDLPSRFLEGGLQMLFFARHEVFVALRPVLEESVVDAFVRGRLATLAPRAVGSTELDVAVLRSQRLAVFFGPAMGEAALRAVGAARGAQVVRAQTEEMEGAFMRKYAPVNRTGVKNGGHGSLEGGECKDSSLQKRDRLGPTQGLCMDPSQEDRDRVSSRRFPPTRLAIMSKRSRESGHPRFNFPSPSSESESLIASSDLFPFDSCGDSTTSRVILGPSRLLLLLGPAYQSELTSFISLALDNWSPFIFRHCSLTLQLSTLFRIAGVEPLRGKIFAFGNTISGQIRGITYDSDRPEEALRDAIKQLPLIEIEKVVEPLKLLPPPPQLLKFLEENDRKGLKKQ